VQRNSACPLCANSGHATPLSEIESRGGVSEIPISDFEYQAAAAFRFLRHHARKPPLTNIKPGTPVPTMGPGTLTGAMAATSSSARAWPPLNGETPH